MTSDRRFVIVGGGLAAAKLAQELRAADFPGSITLIGAEEHLPYERPPLSKEFLFGKKQLPDFTVEPAQWYRDHHVELLLGTTVTGLDPRARTVTLPDGSALPYDKLALATGSTPRRLPVPGADAPGVYTLRTIDDARALAGLFARGRLAIVGAGWIGLEVAAAARAADCAVTVVETAPQPLMGPLGPEMGAVFADLHRAHGVDLRLGARLDAVTTGADGAVTGLALADGGTVAADAVLMAVGAAPNIALAADAGLAVGTGVLVDASLRTSDPDIVAVGDIAEQAHPRLGGRIRVEHWANALNQPAVAAATMLGRAAEYDRLPYFFTDQYDLGMEYTGYATADRTARVVVRGSLADREFVAFWLDAENRVLAGMNVNVWDVTDRIKELITSATPVDPDRLADATQPM
ncbi:FAD-dependent oxidoreductase [Nocardia farcinica]|uniref:Rhodocoxin reductase n=2 Tax=Nocardia TaxID=1817 RepID=A0A0H5P6L4_NOCFR|nr:FAD-dependent oxidoreductase [Nocardia farcinica]AXK85970.1 FAD-dependent oxidoreductase [Nocardia farcinica]MBF6068326.1 FAD-dependent oxidoreductase [Nocardia farcinica]MBF6263520.1 FAD-dependent oxidoreductase [Nocardia farcinica]MBF6282133.1 FAD-dependent oxidoreductase [Nocardia farcinica]MBF6306453.1 FAD-dependent oxidoreductase [Nocardia farcinica]